MLAYTLFTVLTAIGIVITTAEVLLVRSFRRRGAGPGEKHSPSAGGVPLVSILKPVCGLDDALAENLESFAALRGVRFELVLSLADTSDPALRVVEEFRVRHPELRILLVLGGEASLERGNRKVARLVAAARIAAGKILMISDSNVRVSPEDVASTVAMFADPSVGCISNLFVGSGGRNFAARIEALHLLGFVLPGTVLAARAGIPCVVGKSMAISRDALEAIGGFRAFSRVLAEDQAIGLAVKRAGFDVMVSPVVVRNVIERRTLSCALGRQARWNKIRYAFSKGMYTAELLRMPLPFALLSLAVGSAASGVSASRAAMVVVLVVLLRISQLAALARATGAGNARPWLAPVADVLQFAAQLIPYASDRISWRGYTARIGADTILLDLPEAA